MKDISSRLTELLIRLASFRELVANQKVRRIIGGIGSLPGPPETFLKIEKILERVASGAAVRFSELFGQITSRVEIVVTFLALLELIRLNQVRALQRKMFDEIEIAAAAA